MDPNAASSEVLLLRSDVGGTVIDAGALRRGDELHVDATLWFVAEVTDEHDMIEIVVARRSCGAPGTYRFRVRREQPFVARTQHGQRHVYRYEADGRARSGDGRRVAWFPRLMR